MFDGQNFVEMAELRLKIRDEILNVLEAQECDTVNSFTDRDLVRKGYLKALFDVISWMDLSGKQIGSVLIFPTKSFTPSEIKLLYDAQSEGLRVKFSSEDS